MTIAATSRTSRSASALCSARILHWQPLAWTTAAVTLWSAFASVPALPGRIALAGSVLASMTGFLIEDRAASTLSAAPISLPIRRLQRGLISFAVLGVWWVAAVVWSTVRGGARSPLGVALQFAVLASAALAATAVSAKLGDDQGTGVAGLVVGLTIYATTLLPPNVWLRLPADPTTTAATIQNTAILAISTAVLALLSRDPARRHM